MKPRIKLIWHRPSNTMAVADCKAALPLITICDDEVEMINPFFSYPYQYLLGWHGWEEIGDITEWGD